MIGTNVVRTAIPVAVVAAALGVSGPAVAPVRGQDIAYEDVVSRLRSADTRVRLSSLALLKDAGFVDAVVPVAALLNDPVGDVQVLAIETEVSLHLADESYTRTAGRDIVKSKDASLPLLAFAQGQAAVTANLAPRVLISGLVGATASPDPRVRFDAVYAIGVLGPPLVRRGQFPDPKPTVVRLLAALKDTDPVQRAAAMHVLGRLYDAAVRSDKLNPDLMAVRGDVGDMLVAGMNDPDQTVRFSAITAIGQLRHERAIRSLMDYCDYYKRDKLGLAALDALARIAHPSSVSQFASAFDVNDEEMKRIALEGTARIGDKAALAALLARAASDRAAVVRQATAFARARTGDYADLLLIADGFRNRDLQANAFAYFVELGAAVAPSLAGAASYRDPRVRAGIAEVLGVIGTTATLPTLEALARDRDRAVAAAALRSQKRLTVRPPGTPRVP